jgi:REP element-mobilizing transposase RayT
MNRGRRGEEVFPADQDFQYFVDLMEETSELWNLRVAAYYLMPDHYHLLVQTPDGNISRCMRHINGVYTQHFNRRFELDGQLFGGRYKSILIDADSYLLELVRYIHRYPLNAGLIDTLDTYVWSSHKGYVCSVSSVIERVEKSMAEDSTLRERIERLTRLIRSQEKA